MSVLLTQAQVAGLLGISRPLVVARRKSGFLRADWQRIERPREGIPAHMLPLAALERHLGHQVDPEALKRVLEYGKGNARRREAMASRDRQWREYLRARGVAISDEEGPE